MSSNLFSMGGFGIYVWPAYGLTFSVFAYQLLHLYITKKNMQNKVKRFHKSNHDE